jgi:hypothetical protein
LESGSARYYETPVIFETREFSPKVTYFVTRMCLYHPIRKLRQQTILHGIPRGQTEKKSQNLPQHSDRELGS